MKYTPAIITPVLAAGSVASPYSYMLNITQRLCSSACRESTPVFNPSILVKGVTPVGGNQYMVSVHVEGVVSYVPCGDTPCCTKCQLISQDFTLPIFSATAVDSVTVVPGVAVNAISAAACRNCSHIFVCEIPLAVTVTLVTP